MLGRCLAMILMLAVGSGCGGHAASKTHDRRVPLPHSDWFSYRGPLPGRPVKVSTDGFPVEPRSVHLVLTTSAGRDTVPLYVARSRTGRLCIGTTGIFRCFVASDVNPVYALTVFAGRHGTIDWGAVVGLERPGIRTTIELQTPGQITLSPRRVKGFPFVAFASPSYRHNGHLPDTLRFFDRAGNELSGFYDLAFLWQPCPNTPGGCSASWHIGGDAIATMVGREEMGREMRRARRAQAIALQDGFLRSLLRGHEYSIAPAGPWLKQSGGLIGEVLEIHVAPRASYDADFPLAGCSTTAAYNAGVIHYEVSNVSQLDVSVDLNNQRVVGIDPTDMGVDDPAPHASLFGTHVVVKPHPAGGPDHGSCDSGD